MPSTYHFDFCNVLFNQTSRGQRYSDFPSQSFFLFVYISNYIIPFNPHFHNRIFQRPVLVYAYIPPVPIPLSNVCYPSPASYQKDMLYMPPFPNHHDIWKNAASCNEILFIHTAGICPFLNKCSLPRTWTKRYRRIVMFSRHFHPSYSPSSFSANIFNCSANCLDCSGHRCEYIESVVWTFSWPSLSATRLGWAPSLEISKLAWEWRKKSKRLDFLRPSHASLLIHMGFPILAVSERLGHEKVQTTLELYGHLYPDVHGNVAQQLQESAGEYLAPAA